MIENITKINHFGEHLTIDGYGGNFEKLNNKDFVYDFIDSLPSKLGMNKLTDTVIKWADPNDAKDCGGWSAFVMIVESHISIHTFPQNGFFTADVYTCQNGLDAEKIVNLFAKSFETKDTEINFIKRGQRYMEFHNN